MNFQTKNLPDDPTALKQMLVDLQVQLETEKRLNQTLTLRLQALLRQRFGRSSEKQQDTAQLDLLIEDTETPLRR